MTHRFGARRSRREFFATSAAISAGAVVAAGVERASRPAAVGSVESPQLHGARTIDFFGAHQPGIAMEPQAQQNLVALRLLPATTADQLRRLLSLLTDDAGRMTQGVYALADSEPEFAANPARLTVTIGFGPEVVRIVRGDSAVPSWLGPMEAFAIDRLSGRWDGGDVLLQIACDDPITLAHSTRMLLKDTRAFANVQWFQHGFRHAAGTQPPGTTMRNLLGQLDGTANPSPSDPDFDALVWRHDGWLDGGTTMAIRRIEMHLDKWDRLDRGGREATVGRYLDNGAPLTGSHEHDDPDFDATTPLGFPVIAEFAHIRRARPTEPTERIFRRGYNYDLGAAGSIVSDAGLVFTSFQADLERQFLPVQRRLAELDLLNEWTTPIGSAVFAIPPGTTEGGFIGETLFG